MKYDIFKIVESIPFKNLRYKALDKAFEVGIPFNQGLGFHIKTLENNLVVIESRPKRRRKNHLGGAHACALALLGEYPAGMMIAYNFTPAEYRFIMVQLSVTYHKQGRGFLLSESHAPEHWPEFKDGVMWVDMKTEIKNEKSELISEVFTRWQVKKWDLVGKAKSI